MGKLLHLKKQFHRDNPATPDVTRVGYQQYGKIVKEYYMRHGVPTEVPDKDADMILEQNGHIVEVYDPGKDYGTGAPAARPADKKKGGTSSKPKGLYAPKNILMLEADGLNQVFKRNGWKVPKQSVKREERVNILRKMITVSSDIGAMKPKALRSLIDLNAWPQPDNSMDESGLREYVKRAMKENGYPVRGEA